MPVNQKVLQIDASTGFYRLIKYEVGNFFGPIDLGLFLSGRHNSVNIGVGLLAGSIIPGSNRLVFSGFSPCWGGFFISSMGGAGLIFDNLGINMVSILGRSCKPSILYLNRIHGEEIEVELHPVDLNRVWYEGKGGVYSLMDYTYKLLGDRYINDPRILATGPASMYTDFGSICSSPINKGKISYVDTWAGRGGLGSKLLREHGIAAIIYGGTFIDEDFRNRKVADEWFQNKYNKKLAAKDFDATTKYRYDPNFNTGGTFGVNYTTMGGKILAFNYKSIYMDEDERLSIHKNFVLNHYLKQFNEETIQKKQQFNCGEPCVAVCKKMNGEYKKDYEPYQTMGPLCGVFDQREAEKLTHYADMLGFDAISVGGVLSWFMECLSDGLLTKKELGVKSLPVFEYKNFSIETDSMHNAQLGLHLLDSIIHRRGIVDLSEGARKLARRLSRAKNNEIINKFIFNSFARKGWIVPNQYWTPGVLSPMPIMGKYYMYYGGDFLPPRELGKTNANRFRQELMLDNFGMCRFHRKWAEDMIPLIIESLFDKKEEFLKNISITTSRINSRNASIFWESERDFDFVYSFLQRKHDVEGNNDPELMNWLDKFKKDKKESSLNFWYEIHKGVHESLREF